MLIGHFAVGLAAKRIEPQVSAGTMVLAAMFADLLWCVLMLAGLEHVQFKPGIGAGNYFSASNIVISHSLRWTDFGRPYYQQPTPANESRPLRLSEFRRNEDGLPSS